MSSLHLTMARHQAGNLRTAQFHKLGTQHHVMPQIVHANRESFK